MVLGLEQAHDRPTNAQPVRTHPGCAAFFLINCTMPDYFCLVGRHLRYQASRCFSLFRWSNTGFSTSHHEPTATRMVQGTANRKFKYQRWRLGPINTMAC